VYAALAVVGVKDPIAVFAPPSMLYWMLTLDDAVVVLTWETMLKLETLKFTVPSLVMLKVYHLLFVIALASVVLNPEPLIPLAALPQATPLPLEIWEKVNPATAGDIVAMGEAGQVTLLIPV
jgi:hypothetical protein